MESYLRRLMDRKGNKEVTIVVDSGHSFLGEIKTVTPSLVTLVLKDGGYDGNVKTERPVGIATNKIAYVLEDFIYMDDRPHPKG